MNEITNAGRGSFLDSPLIGLVVAKGLITIRRRNAWHNTTSTVYRGESSLNLDLDEARSVAESWRKKGSAFQVKEVPGIALLTAEGLALTTDFHHNNSFANWDVARGGQQLTIGAPMGEALSSLGASGAWTILPNPHSIVRGADRWASIEPVTRATSFLVHSSVSYGRRHKLGWQTKMREEVSTRGVQRIRRAFLVTNGPDSVQNGLIEYIAARDARLSALHERMAERGRQAKSRIGARVGGLGDLESEA